MTPVVLRSCSFLLRRVVKGSQSISFPTLLKCIHPDIYVGLNTNVKRSLRKFSVPTSVHDDIDEQEFYSEYDFSAKIVANRNRAISIMQTIFGISPNQAQIMVRKYPELKCVSLKSAECNIQFLNDEGISMATLKENPWLLTYKIETLSSKLEILKKLDFGDVNTILPLLQITLLRLKEHSAIEERESIPHGNRIKYTCEKLKCGLAEACKVFVKYEFLYTIPFQRYSDVMETLLDAGVSPSHILRDVWVFRYSIRIIKTRLAILKEVGIKPIKPWMLRSSPETFAITIQREVSRKEVLGENSVVDYLTQQLQCDVKTVEHISSKYPSILRIHVSKLKELFDFLFTEGYTPQQVLQVPRILFHSVDTIKFRALELKDAGYSPTTLITLCKSKREFEKILETAWKRKYKNTS